MLAKKSRYLSIVAVASCRLLVYFNLFVPSNRGVDEHPVQMHITHCEHRCHCIRKAASERI